MVVPLAEGRGGGGLGFALGVPLPLVCVILALAARSHFSSVGRSPMMRARKRTHYGQGGHFAEGWHDGCPLSGRPHLVLSHRRKGFMALTTAVTKIAPGQATNGLGKHDWPSWKTPTATGKGGAGRCEVLYLSGKPRSQWGGALPVFHVDGPSSNEARPNHRRQSYSPINVTRECRMMSVTSRPIPYACRIGQVNGADEFGAISFVPFAPTKFAPKVVFVIPGWSGTSPSTLHLIRRPVIEKNTLLLSTLKGTSSAAPKEGGPGEKTGAVGHGGPPKIAGKPETMPNESPTKVRKPDAAVQYGCVRINWSHDWRCGEPGDDFGLSVFCLSVAEFCLGRVDGFSQV
jgi:hypothetical protein